MNPSAYRNKTTNDLAFLVEGGIQLDRPDAPVIPYHEEDWIPEPRGRQLSAMQVAMVAHAADTQLGKLLGWRVTSWPAMSDKEKRTFLRTGPSRANAAAGRLFAAVKVALVDTEQ